MVLFDHNYTPVTYWIIFFPSYKSFERRSLEAKDYDMYCVFGLTSYNVLLLC